MKGHGATCGCPCCDALSTDQHSRYSECSLHSLPWKTRDHDSYLAELKTQTIIVNITTLDEKTELLDSLVWKVKYPWGRRIKARHGGKFGLKTGDKLSIGGDIGIDMHAVEGLSAPFKLVFFREAKSAIAGVSLMWNIVDAHQLGIDYFEIVFFVDCTLHTVDLGVAPRYCGHAIRCALRNNIFNLPHPTLHERLQVGALHIRKALKKHYTKSFKADPLQGRRVSRVQAFSLNKLGKLSTPCVKAKGAQGKALVWFCRDLMQKHIAICGKEGQFLAAAGSSLVAYYDVLRTEHRKMNLKAKLELMNHCINHLEAYKLAGGHMVPKHHGFVHLTRSINFSGNPRCTSTYEDESENGIVAAVGVRVHRSTFVKSTFERLELYQELVRPR
jgi:hypothetical protein